MNYIEKVIRLLTYKQIASIYESRNDQIKQLISLVDNNHKTHSLYSIERFPRDVVSIKTIQVYQTELSLSELLTIGFLPQLIEPSFTNPKRIIGTVLLPSRIKRPVCRLVQRINWRGTIVQKGMLKLFPDKHVRRKKYQELEQGVITSTLYKKIIIAPPSSYLVTHSWCNSQKAPIEISREQAENILMSNEKGEDHFCVDERIAKDMARLNGFKGKFYRYLDVRAHPIQYCNHLDGSQRKRKSIKAASPTLVFDDSPKVLKVKPPVSFTVIDPKYYIPADYVEISSHHRIVAKRS